MSTELKHAAQRALDDICGAKLCEINSMSSRREMIRLMDCAIDELRSALALQQSQATQAEVTDADIDAVTIQQWGDQRGAPLQAHRAYARAILALRPVQAPMTREQAMVIVQSNPDTMTAIRMAEVHHGITADSGEVQTAPQPKEGGE